MFVKKVKQRLEVCYVSVRCPIYMLIVFCSGIDTLTRKICPCTRLLGSYKPCCMPNGSSLITSTTFSAESRTMACDHIFAVSLSSHRIPTGTGAVYSFDPVGSYEREACRAAGAAQSLVQPFLDNQVRLFLPFYEFFLSSYPTRLHTRDPELSPNLYHL